jgi:hypothetical protein
MKPALRIHLLGWTDALLWSAVFWSVLGVGCVRLTHAAKRVEVKRVLADWGAL